MEYVITVDEADRPTGTEEKLAAHQKGILHRAFSIFLFNDQGEMLLQQRALDKYHSGGLWTNACCSHPAPGEETMNAAHRRLNEEMGFDCDLKFWKTFQYHAAVNNELTEHEIDHLYTGTYNGVIIPTPQEVYAYRYASLADIKKWMDDRPETFTAWFRMIFPDFL
jgi:isopentenyl-diphosphate delta-isomerase